MKPNDFPIPPDAQAARQHWLSELALAPPRVLEQTLERLAAAAAPLPQPAWLRQPQTGLYMVRARAGGTGAQFNLGEASVTRCAVQDAAGRIGIGYVRGSDGRHAELVALFDLALQDPARQPELLETVISPLAASRLAVREQASREAAATRVAFYTMARESA